MPPLVLVSLLACGAPASDTPRGPGAADPTTATGSGFSTGGALPPACLEPPPPPVYRRISPEVTATYTPLVSSFCVLPGEEARACERYGPSLGDLDGDGRIEVLWEGFRDGSRVWPIDEVIPGTGGQPASLAPDPEHPDLQSVVDGAGLSVDLSTLMVGLSGLADLDDDGDLDLLTWLPSGEGWVMALLADGPGFTPLRAPTLPGGVLPGQPAGVDRVDWDGDGRTDLLQLLGEPHSAEVLANGWTLNLVLQRGPGDWQAVPWIGSAAGVPLRDVAQLNLVRAGGEPYLLAAGNTSQDGAGGHPLLFDLHDDLDPEGLPVALPVETGGPRSSDGPLMGGAVAPMVLDLADPAWVPVALTTIDSDLIQGHARDDQRLWVDRTAELGLDVTPNTWVHPEAADGQLPWLVTPIDDHTIAIANGDDAGSWITVDGEPMRTDWYYGHDQIVDLYRLGADGRYARITDAVEVDGQLGPDGQPGGSYRGFYERGGLAVWVASWIDDANPEGVIARSWVGERLWPEGHHWLTVAPRGTTSNPEALGTDVYVTTEPDCADELTHLLEQGAPDPDVARACGACAYRRQEIGAHDAGHLLTSSEVVFYLGPDTEGAPSATVVLRYPSGTVHRLDGIGAGKIAPVEPDTVEVIRDATGATIRFQPAHTDGSPATLSAFGPEDVEVLGVPAAIEARLGADGVGEIVVTAPSAADLDAWTAANPLSTASTAFRIRGSAHRPRLFWP